MKPLQELLLQRDAIAPGELLVHLREGLSQTPSKSNTGQAIHQLLLDYFKLDERACNASFASAFKRYPDTAVALLVLCAEHQLTPLATLMQSVLQGDARPHGGFQQALKAVMAEKADQPGLVAALQGFATAAFASPAHEAEMELSLAWEDLEDCLLDQVAEHAAVIDFDWGPTERKKRQEAQAVQAALAQRPAAQWLQDFWHDIAPCVLAQPSEWDMDHEGVPKDVTPVPVQHVAHQDPLSEEQTARLAAHPAASQLWAVYRQTPGAALFCTDPNDLWSAGFLLLAPSQWNEASAEMLDWLTQVDFQDEPEGPPAWVRSAIAFGKIPGDASYWMLPTEGPWAGHVLLSNDDVNEETSRYPSFDAFVATLRLFPQNILGCGGYVSYPDAEGDVLRYPVGYRSGR